MQLDPTQFVVTPAAGRTCGTCTLCCKVFEVPVLSKPAGQWCRHCQTGRGCGIHETRPEHCRAFHCLWISQDFLGPEWKPEIAKFVLTMDPVNRFLLAQMDPGQPGAWKREPYQTQLRRWAAAAQAEGRLVVVFVNRSATIILPDRDVSLGVLGTNDRVVAETVSTPSGPRFEVRKITVAT